MLLSPDVVLPTVISATLDLANGRLVVLTSETLDLTPTSSEINLDRLYLANLPLDTNDRITLTGAEPVASDATEITITLTEPQRVRAIQTSGTQGGDGSPVTLEGDESAFNDLSANTTLAFNTKTGQNLVITFRQQCCLRPLIILLYWSFLPVKLLMLMPNHADTLEVRLL